MDGYLVKLRTKVASILVISVLIVSLGFATYEELFAPRSIEMTFENMIGFTILVNQDHTDAGFIIDSVPSDNYTYTSAIIFSPSDAVDVSFSTPNGAFDVTSFAFSSSCTIVRNVTTGEVLVLTP